jgi:hypothetical protein
MRLVELQGSKTAKREKHADSPLKFKPDLNKPRIEIEFVSLADYDVQLLFQVSEAAAPLCAVQGSLFKANQFLRLNLDSNLDSTPLLIPSVR